MELRGESMSGYNVEHFLNDFADRTLHNLSVLEKDVEAYKLNEVTQLINSLLGLIIIPVEACKSLRRIDSELKKSSKEDYEKICKLLEKCKAEKRFFSDYETSSFEDNLGHMNVDNFIRHLRNALSHGGDNGLHFYPISEEKKITNVIFYDNDKVNKNNIIHEFCIDLTVSELTELAMSISQLYCKFEKKDENSKNKIEKYESEIESLEKLMSEGRRNASKVVFEFCDTQS